MSEKKPALFIDRATSPVGISIIIGIVILLSLGAYLSVRIRPKQQSALAPTPTPRAIPHGPKGFTVGQSDKTVPQFGTGTIDPYDPAQGASQSATITVKHTRPVTQVTAVLKTDNAISPPLPLVLVKGTATDGTWQGSWQVYDTYLYTYAMVLQATSADVTGSVEITLR